MIRFSKLHIFLFGIVCVGFVAMLLPVSVHAWCDSSWKYRNTVTISSTNVDDDLTDFPLLIDVTDTNLAANASSTALDIFFVEEANCTKLDWEKESYDNSTGELQAWVKVSTVSSSTDTVLHMYYGNLNAADQSDATNAWDANFKGVWHMAEDPSVSTDGDCGGGTKEVCDSTSNNYDADSGGTMTSADQVAGQIGNGIDFDGSDDYLDMGDPTTDDLGLEFASGDNLMTIEMWINPRSSGGSSNGRIVYKTDQAANQGYNFLMAGATGSEQIALSTNDGTSINTSAGSIATSTWAYVVATHHSGTTGDLFINGASSTTGTTGNISENAISFTIANNDASITQNRGFDGIIDEIRVSDVARSNAWIKFSYHNQVGTAGTVTLGSQECPTCGRASTPSVSSISLEDITSTSAKVVWYTFPATNNTRLAGEPAASYPDSSSQISTRHEAYLANLSPDTLYGYAIHAGAPGYAIQSMASFLFATLAAESGTKSGSQGTDTQDTSADIEVLSEQVKELQLKVIELSRQLISLLQSQIITLRIR